MTLNERLSIPIWKKVLLIVLSLILFAIQTILLLFVFDFWSTFNSPSSPYFRLFYSISIIISIFFVFHIINKSINCNYKLTWCILILIFPLPGCFLYIMNAGSKRLTKYRRLKIRSEVSNFPIEDKKSDLWDNDSIGGNFVSVIQKSSFAPVYKNVDFTYFYNISDKFNDLILNTTKAKHYIFIEYFIISSGYLMDQLYPILKQKGEEGVIIKILYDDIGSKLDMNKKLIKELTKIKNCEIENYQPIHLLINFLSNYRDHRKIYIIDGKIAYCGGDNLADEYINKRQRFGYWRDTCGKYEGEIVNSFVYMFKEMWYISTGKRLADDLYKPTFDLKENGYFVPFGDGPLYEGNPGYDLFMSMISTSSKNVYISSPYFIVDDALINMICLKAKQGVDIRILLPGKPDKKIPYYIARKNYKDLLTAGVKIYEFTPGFNHAKSIVVDGKYLYLGTLNMDYRSLFLHYECGVLIMHNNKINEVYKDFNDCFLKSKLVTYDDFKKRPIHEKVLSYFASFFNPLL